MGYTTIFSEGFKFNKNLNQSQANLINMQILSWSEQETYCPWSVKKDYSGQFILTCEDTKCHNYIDWIKFIIEKLSKIYCMSGTVYWRGEDFSDNGKIIVCNNEMSVYIAKYVEMN